MNATLAAELDAAIGAALHEAARFGVVRRVHAAIGSTNDEAAAWSRQGAPHGALVVADTQHKGRGRQGRVWQSPSGEGLYFSLVLRPTIPPMAAPTLTLAVGLALLDAARALGADAHLKWPNDLLADEPDGRRRKLAGVLTEMATSGMRIEHVIVGIGLNVAAEHMPTELEAIATSLRRVTGRSLDRGHVLSLLLGALEERYDRFITDGPAATVQAWKHEAGVVGQRVTLRAGVEHKTGVVEDVDDAGALCLRDDVGTLHRLWAGDLEPLDAPVARN